MQTAWLAVLLVVVASCAAKRESAARLDAVNTRSGANTEAGMFSRADAYERFMGRWSRQLAPALIAYSEVHDGGAILDVGSGTGALTFALRDATTTAHLLGIDLSPEYVRYASSKNDEARLRFEVGDAQALRQSDGSFDRSISLLVLNFVPDPRRAVAEMIRVTKPGGIVSSAVWDYAEGMEMLLCKPGELATLFREARLEAVSETALVTELHFSSFGDYWEPFGLGQGPAGAYVATLSPERRGALRERLRARLLGNAADQAFEMRARAWAAKGTVPLR